MMRALPNMTVLVPCDLEQAKKATLAAARLATPAYIRTSRENTPLFTTPQTPFEIGKANVYRDGKDVAIFACGLQVFEALKAAEELKKKGIDAAVIDMHSIKPIDKETVVLYAKKCGVLVSAEDHQINGGLGSAIAEIALRTAIHLGHRPFRSARAGGDEGQVRRVGQLRRAL